MSPMQIIDQAIEALKQHIGPITESIGTKVAASALWDWMKKKFKPRSAATIEAVEDVEKSPDLEANWDILRAQLNKALAEDEALLKELGALVAQLPQAVHQEAHLTGDGNKIAQIHGDGNTTRIS